MKINPKKNDFYIIKTNTEYVENIREYCKTNGYFTQSRIKNYTPIARIDDGELTAIVIRKYNKNNYLVHFHCLVYIVPKFEIVDDEIKNIKIINIYPDSNGKY